MFSHGPEAEPATIRVVLMSLFPKSPIHLKLRLVEKRLNAPLDAILSVGKTQRSNLLNGKAALTDDNREIILGALNITLAQWEKPYFALEEELGVRISSNKWPSATNISGRYLGFYVCDDETKVTGVRLGGIAIEFIRTSGAIWFSHIVENSGRTYQTGGECRYSKGMYSCTVEYEDEWPHSLFCLRTTRLEASAILSGIYVDVETYNVNKIFSARIIFVPIRVSAQPATKYFPDSEEYALFMPLLGYQETSRARLHVGTSEMPDEELRAARSRLVQLKSHTYV